MEHKENKPNTEFSYMYRDAGNWKQYQDIIARGTLTESQVAKIFSACDEEGNFIPDDVGFPEKRFDRITPCGLLRQRLIICSAAMHIG